MIHISAAPAQERLTYIDAIVARMLGASTMAYDVSIALSLAHRGPMSRAEMAVAVAELEGAERQNVLVLSADNGTFELA